MVGYLDLLRTWWRRPDNYNWLSAYLETQRLRGIIQVVMVLIVGALATVALVMRFSPRGPAPGLPATVSTVVIVSTYALVFLWAMRWPRRWQSHAFVMIATALVAASALVHQDPTAALFNCTIFGAIGAYVGFAHNARLLAAVLATGAITTLVCAARLSAAGDPSAGVAQGLMTLIVLLSAPCTAQLFTQILGSDAAESDVDVLTAIYNRRGFYRAAGDLINRDAGRLVSVIMIDIDGFKTVNDTRGHAAGDRLLVAIAAILHRSADDAVVVGRYGGEEFVVATTVGDAALGRLAERLRGAVAALPDNVTVSVGVATAAAPDITGPRARQVLDQLTDAADRAMYEGKRAGGDRVRHVHTAIVD
ncbi:diguanylate cyclase [Mycobacterium sp. C31M]